MSYNTDGTEGIDVSQSGAQIGATVSNEVQGKSNEGDSGNTLIAGKYAKDVEAFAPDKTEDKENAAIEKQNLALSHSYTKQKEESPYLQSDIPQETSMNITGIGQAPLFSFAQPIQNPNDQTKKQFLVDLLRKKELEKQKIEDYNASTLPIIDAMSNNIVNKAYVNWQYKVFEEGKKHAPVGQIKDWAMSQPFVKKAEISWNNLSRVLNDANAMGVKVFNDKNNPDKYVSDAALEAPKKIAKMLDGLIETNDPSKLIGDIHAEMSKMTTNVSLDKIISDIKTVYNKNIRDFVTKGINVNYSDVGFADTFAKISQEGGQFYKAIYGNAKNPNAVTGLEFNEEFFDKFADNKWVENSVYRSVGTDVGDEKARLNFRDRLKTAMDFGSKIDISHIEDDKAKMRLSNLYGEKAKNLIKIKTYKNIEQNVNYKNANGVILDGTVHNSYLKAMPEGQIKIGATTSNVYNVETGEFTAPVDLTGGSVEALQIISGTDRYGRTYNIPAATVVVWKPGTITTKPSKQTYIAKLKDVQPSLLSSSFGTKNIEDFENITQFDPNKAIDVKYEDNANSIPGYVNKPELIKGQGNVQGASKTGSKVTNPVIQPKKIKKTTVDKINKAVGEIE